MSRSIKLNPYRPRNKGLKDDPAILWYKLYCTRRWKKNKKIWKVSQEKKLTREIYE